MWGASFADLLKAKEGDCTMIGEQSNGTLIVERLTRSRRRKEAPSISQIKRLQMWKCNLSDTSITSTLLNHQHASGPPSMRRYPKHAEENSNRCAHGQRSVHAVCEALLPQARRNPNRRDCSLLKELVWQGIHRSGPCESQRGPSFISSCGAYQSGICSAPLL
jgi:hypothetical protein